MIYLQLFWCFLQVGLFSIGGGYAAMPLIQSQVVEHYGWLSMGEFTDLITIAEMTPGPIAVNCSTFVGIRIAGIAGVVVAMLGCIFPSLIIVSILAYVYYRFKDIAVLQNVLSGLRPVVVALIAAAGINILKQVLWADRACTLAEMNLVGFFLFLAAFFVLRWKKCSPILVMSLCGVIGMCVYALTGGQL